MRFHVCSLCTAILVFASSVSHGQISVNYRINTDAGHQDISPYIYGVNMMSSCEFSTARRMGGNRLTGFNWENNASNAGADYYHTSDNYIPWTLGVSSANYSVPGISLTAFHSISLAQNDYSLLTLPLAGFVARDKNGVVTQAQTAPSSRWVAVANEKATPFSLVPDTTDGVIYIDEMLNFLIDSYGTASSPTGIRGYIMDNEPGLWYYTHPRIHPAKVTVAELISKSIDLAATVKGMDSSADVFGPDLYGFSAQLNLQNAPDWPNYSGTYNRFVDAYLDCMSNASDSVGYRLLDVLDIHWYPAPAGVFAGDTSAAVCEVRMQVPRSLWDSTYVEPSWIGQYYSPVVELDHLQQSIDQYFPYTKIAVTEYGYGASTHISGGIAQVEALGIFGKYGVYFASLWGNTSGYITTAYNMFTNYDGNEHTFGSTSVSATMNDRVHTSVYASLDNTYPNYLHVIVTNKSSTDQISGNFQIQSTNQYSSAEAWYFNRYSMDIHRADDFTVSGNQFSYTIPPLSVYHILLQTSTSIGEETVFSTDGKNVEVLFNNLEKTLSVRRADGGRSGEVDISVFDIAGRIVKQVHAEFRNNTVSVNVSDFSTGIYFASAVFNNSTTTKRFTCLN